jgi:hypothetical protein
LNNEDSNIQVVELYKPGSLAFSHVLLLLVVRSEVKVFRKCELQLETIPATF